MRKTAHSLGTLLLTSALFASGCVADVDDTQIDDLGGKPESDGKLVDGKADAWNATNNPGRFNVDFDYKLANLPSAGKADVTPWPDTYWPTYKDSSNQRWQGEGEMSPLEKYDMAFNGWQPGSEFMSLKPYTPATCGQSFDAAYYQQLGPAAKYQSANKGNKNARDGIDNDGDGEIDECDDYDGVETWWGLCHAWVPAAILEKEPVRAVTYNGVTFDVGDIKALIISQYDRPNAFMLGGRCNEKEVERDEHGRLTQEQCRDTNAGSFHVVLTNMLGRYKRSFAEDRTYDYEVWNQPFYDYQILSQVEVTAKQAMAELGEPDQATYKHNDEATRFYKVRTKVRYITEPSQSTTYPLVPEIENQGRHLGSDTYDYILELNAAGDVIGGEWVGYSQTTHPDFLWLPTGTNGGNPHLNLAKIRMLIDMSTAEEEPGEQEIETFTNTTEVSIPDNDATGIVSTLEVARDIAVGSLQVELDIDHSYRGDLKVTLEKDGVVVTLHNREGGGADHIKQTFDAPGFAGMSAKGTWRLRVSDHAAWDKGTLKSWALTVGTGEAAAPGEHSATGLPLAIPDNNQTGISSKVSVNQDGTVKTLKVRLGVTHTYIGDLRITLTKGGVQKTLHSREGGSADDIDKVFTVDGFTGSALRGDWVLSVSDLAGQDVGTLDDFTIIAATQ